MQGENRRTQGKAEAYSLLSDRGDKCFVAAAAAAHVDTQALDLLVQRREWNHKSLSRFCLIPGGALEHIGDNPALYLVHDLEQRRMRAVRSVTSAWLSRQRRQKFRKLQTRTAHDL